jgi:hypothetical protein
MENSKNENINDPNDKPHPKPTDDVGANIETVTPDTEKEGLPNDQKNNPAKDDKETNESDVETITPGSENDNLPESDKTTPEETNVTPEETNVNDKADADNQGNIEPTNPETDKNQHKGDGPEIETVTP